MSKNFELLQQMQRDRSDSVASLLEESQYSGGEWASDESLRLVQQVFLTHVKNPPRVVVFAGIDHGNGCSQTCASVAEALAKNTSGSVCIVEANFRSPGLPQLLRATNPLGLTDALLQDGPIRSFASPVGIDKLWLLSCGTLTADSASLLSSEQIKARLAELRAEFYCVRTDKRWNRFSTRSRIHATGSCSDGGSESADFAGPYTRRCIEQAYISYPREAL
jgi:Mrp family chromosome partitioning ATPase